MQRDGKKRIIQAAQRLIAQRGVEKTSMRDIAEEAGITTGAIYYYYKSKEDLLYEVMDYAMAITANIMEIRKESAPPPNQLLDEIARQVTRRLKVGSARRLRFYLAYQAALGDEELRKKFADDYSAQAQRTAELFNYVFEMESQPQDKYLAILMIAALDGLNLQQFIGTLPVDSEEIAKVYNEFFAYAVPGFLQHWHEMNRFDHLNLEGKEAGDSAS
ncbi:MAG: TetR/AcrR family transcriptional regulator [Anaerolineaceae bacterium]|nr:TetR/AcrR family transcriptional regulator [Anaerolineaceae bacterium]